MKIIKHGLPPHQRVARLTCRECNTEIEVEQGECTLHAAWGIREPNYYSVKCPTCHYEITIATEVFR